MSRRGPGIRLRLTLSYMAVLLIILLLLSIGIWYLMRDRVGMMVRAGLDAGYSTVETVIINSGGDIFDLRHLGNDELILVLMNGEPEYQTLGWDRAGLPVDRTGLGSGEYAGWTSADGRSYSIRKGTIPEYRYTLFYAKETTEAAAVPGELAAILVIAGIAAFALSLLGGYFLAGRALSPVREITEKARDISADNLSARLPVPHERDEIGSLASVFNDTLARLEQSFEKLRRFTADASHELRTPLTSIRSVGEVALRGPESADSYRESIQSMLEETGRLTRLTDDLLMLARGDAGSAGLRPVPVDLSGMVNGVIDEMKVLAEEKGQKISTGLRDGIMITADRSTLTLAISNVLHNAIMYTPEGGEITVETGISADGAYIEIVDSGPGIPEAERSKVFERFFRLDDARTRESGGSGLGLAIAKWAVEAAGGEIRFIDPGDRGSRCRITLRRAAS
jgi:heavy metal sensor kinase